MRGIRVISITGIWSVVMALSLSAQVSTFPAPPPLPPPSDSSSGSGAKNSAGQTVAPFPSDGEPAIQSPGATAAAITNAPPASPVTAATLTSMAALDDKITIEPGDTISFRVIEDRDQAIPLVVTDTGEVNFPYINRVKVQGKTCHQVAMEVKKLLEVDYYKRATVIVGLDVILGEDKGKAKDLAWVVGEVRQVGPFELQKSQPMTVSQIILRAGGFGDFADKRKIKVLHRDPKATETPGDNQYLDSDNVKNAQIVDVQSVYDGKSNVDPVVKPGDYIIVPKEWVHF